MTSEDVIMLSTPKRGRFASLSSRIKKYQLGREVLHAVKEANDTRLEDFISNKNWDIDTRYKVTRQLDPILDRENLTTEADNKWYFTPLHIAIENGWTSGALMLLNNMANIDALAIKHQSGFQRGKVPSVTPLMVAIQHNNTQVVKKLISMGCNIDFRCQVTKNNAVIYAVQKANANVLQRLINGGADINFEHKFPSWFAPISALCRCVYYFNNATNEDAEGINRNMWYEVIEVLVEGGADTNAKCGMISVIDMSSQCKDKRVYKLLKSRCANNHTKRKATSSSFTQLKKTPPEEKSELELILRNPLRRASTSRRKRQTHFSETVGNDDIEDGLTKIEIFNRLRHSTQKGCLPHTRSETAINEKLQGKNRRSFTTVSQTSSNSNSSKDGDGSKILQHAKDNHISSIKNLQRSSSCAGSSSDETYRQKECSRSFDDDIQEEEMNEAYLNVHGGSIDLTVGSSHISPVTGGVTDCLVTLTDRPVTATTDGLLTPNHSQVIVPVGSQTTNQMDRKVITTMEKNVTTRMDSQDISSANNYDFYINHDIIPITSGNFMLMAFTVCTLGLFLVMNISNKPPENIRTCVTMVTTDLVLPLWAFRLLSHAAAAVMALLFIYTTYLVLS